VYNKNFSHKKYTAKRKRDQINMRTQNIDDFLLRTALGSRIWTTLQNLRDAYAVVIEREILGVLVVCTALVDED
jgi:hypothetical protein